jgi:hypothetical protein
MNRLFTVLIMCCVAAPLAAQEAVPDAKIAVREAATMADDGGPMFEGVVLAFRQLPKPAPAPPTPEHTGIKAMFRELGTDIQHLPSKENLLWVGIGGGVAAAVHPVDSTANKDLSGPFLDKFFKPGAILGQSYTLLPVSVTIYAIGRLHEKPRVSHMGSDLIQSLLIAELMTQTVKYSVRRERPDGSGANSFPSGHAADTMAFATALERHFNWKYYLPAYAGATYVAMSRLHDNVHFASDVAFGAAVGIIAGRTVTRPGHRPFPVQVSSVPGGLAIQYARFEASN